MTEITWPEIFGTATVHRLKAHAGHHLEAGDILLEAETSEAMLELEVFDACQIIEILVQEGQEIHAQDVIALISSVAPASIPKQEQKAKTLSRLPQPDIDISPNLQRIDQAKVILLLLVIGLTVALLICTGLI